MRALGEERMIITECISGHFARAGHDAGVCQRLVILQEKICRDDADAALDERFDLRTERTVGEAGGASAGIVEPDDDFARGVGRLEPIDGNFFAVGLIDERPLRPEVGIAPLRAGVRKLDLNCLGE